MKLPDILILAGGKAKRLGKLCFNKPKSLINFYDKPFLFYQLKLLKKKKFNKVIICTGYLSKQIEQYINISRNDFNLYISFSNDGKTQLGTGGAIKKVLPLLTRNFFVIFGDSYLDINYLKVYKKFLSSKKLGLMTVYKNNNQHDLTGEGLSDVELCKGKIIKYNKKKRNSRMKYINYGISIFNKSLFKNLILKKKFDVQVIYQQLIKKKSLLSYEIKNNIYEIGSVKGVNLTKKLFKRTYK